VAFGQVALLPAVGHATLRLTVHRYPLVLVSSSMSDKSDGDNHANQGNPNNDAYWESRGLDERPDDWEDLAEGDKGREDKDDE